MSGKTQHGNFAFVLCKHASATVQPKETGRLYIMFSVLAAGVMFSCKHTKQGLVHTTAHLQTHGKI